MAETLGRKEQVKNHRALPIDRWHTANTRSGYCTPQRIRGQTTTMAEPSSSGSKRSEKNNNSLNGRFLPDDPAQRKVVLSIVESLRDQCLEDGGVHWDLDDAVGFVHKVKVVFRNDPRGYLLFLHILSKVPNKERSLKDIFEQVKILFRSDPNLLEDFMNFLPSSLTKRPSREDAISYVKTVKQTLRDEGKYEEFLKLVDACRTCSISPGMLMSKAQEIFQEHQHLINGLSDFLGRG